MKSLGIISMSEEVQELEAQVSWNHHSSSLSGLRSLGFYLLHFFARRPTRLLHVKLFDYLYSNLQCT